jgi:hypothetical protein
MSKNIHLLLDQRDTTPLCENVYSKFASDVHFLMQSLYGGRAPDLKVSMSGDQSQIMSFFTALQREKRYMDSYLKHGLGDAQTMASRYQLDAAVKQFEFETGLRWPFTH